MSFLNPVNEPVLRFKSTDASAPQINYNARTAGDIKAVLKACLVTGYGAKASAGWTAVNEVANVIEFVSPSVAMSDYRLGIDDSTTASTTWYYQYQNVRVDPSVNARPKSFSYIDKTSPENGWQLLVTARGIFFVEIMQHPAIVSQVARVTYWGQLKSALLASSSKNIAFGSFGYNAGVAPYFFNKASQSNRHYILGDYVALDFTGANIPMVGELYPTYGVSAVEIVSALYLNDKSTFCGQHPGIFTRTLTSSAGLFGVKDAVFNDRPVLSIFVTTMDAADWYLERYGRAIYLSLDAWEY